MDHLVNKMVDAFTPGLLGRLAQQPKKVVVLKASRIGDLLCAIPAIRALHCVLPQAELSLITLPMLEELAKCIPEIDRIIQFPGYPGIAEQLFNPEKTARFFLDMQSEQFDLAIQLQGSGVYSNPFILMLGAKVTAGMIRKGDPPGRLDAAFPEVKHGHEIHRILEFVKFLGAEPHGEDIHLNLLENDNSKIEERLSGLPRPWIGIHPAARDRTRRWRADRFGAVGRTLVEKYGGSVILLAEGEEMATASEVLRIANVCGSNLTGQLNIPQLTSVLSKLDILITTDSGPAHLAYATGCPSVTIFGSADPQRYGPLQKEKHKIVIHPVDCRPCGLSTCPIGYQCLEGVSVESVLHVADSLLQT